MKLFYKSALASSLLALAVPSVNAAFDDAGTDYTNQESPSYVESGPAGDVLQMVDFLLCVMEKSNATTNPNLSYSVLVDEAACNGESTINPEIASQTITTSGNSNPTAADPYIVDSWFVTSEGEKVVAKTIISSGATDDLPNGVFTMDWKFVDAGNMMGSGGSLKFNADGTASYLENFTQDAGVTDEFKFVHGTISADGSSGNLRIQNQSYDANGDRILPIHRYVFDASHLHFDTDSAAAQCFDRASTVSQVYGYQLFDSAGAEVEMNGAFNFKYGSTNQYDGYASAYGAWLGNGESNGNKPTQMTRRSDSVVYNVCYDDDWESDNGANYDDGFDDNVAGGTTVCGTADDGVSLGLTNQVTNVAYAFSPAVEFDSVSFDDRSTTTVNVAEKTLANPFFNGVGSSLGFVWECLLPTNVQSDTWISSQYTGGINVCEDAIEYRPGASMPNGTKLIETGTAVEFYVKSMDEVAYLVEENDVTDCADLPLANAPASAGYTKADIDDVSLLWSALPVLTEANTVKYVHGVAQ